jgi:peroxiredoxin
LQRLAAGHGVPALNLLKSLYVSTFIAAAFTACVIAIWQLWLGHEALAWVGVLIACAPTAAFFTRLLLQPVARTSANLWPLIAGGVTGTAVALFAAGIDHPATWTALGLGIVGNLLYIHWYSRFGARDSERLAIGRMLPAFALEAVDGSMRAAASFLGRPVLWVFYRGNWCPLCMAQIREVAAQYRELAQRGAEVVLISPQPASHTQTLAQRFDAPMTFMVDRDNAAARLLGILAENGLPTGLQVLGYEGDVPMPTVLITDAAGRIVYADLTDNYRVRPEPAEFIATLDRIGL